MQRFKNRIKEDELKPTTEEINRRGKGKPEVIAAGIYYFMRREPEPQRRHWKTTVKT